MSVHENRPGRYIEVIGGLGIGKTSLVKAFNQVSGYHPLLEQEEDLKHLFFVKEYLSHPEKYAFEGALNFTGFHLNRIQERLHHLPPETNVVSDASLLMQYAYAKGYVDDEEMETLVRVLKHAYKKLPKVALFVVPDLDVHAERIRQRGRATETGVPKSFLENVRSNIREALNVVAPDVPVLFLDAEKYDWANNDVHKKAVVEQAAHHLRQTLG